VGADLSGRPVVGRRFGSYVVEALIGAGGMGAVYRAVQPEIGKQVAVKFLSAALTAQPELVQRFFAEARAVNLIQHDNIVDIFDFGSADGQSWFVMELLRGRSLTAVLAYEGRLAVGRTVDICIQIADAIAAAHGRGIIHRDLKGDNIFLVTHGGREDFIKILDFGIAKLSDPGSLGGGSPSGMPGMVSHTRTGAILGTPGYMSPEQGTGGTVDGRTDVYALGVIAYRMLTGRLPYEGLNHLEIVQKQLTSAPPPLVELRPDAPPGLADLVHQMLATKPEGRPQKMHEVRDRLRMLSAEPRRPPSQNYPIAPTLGAEPVSTLSGASGQMSQVPSEGPFPAYVPSVPGTAPPRPQRTGLIVGLVGVAVAGGVAAVVLLRPQPAHEKPAAPVVVVPAEAPPAAPKPKPHVAPSDTFDCLIETDPPGAQVLRSGHALGQTPVRLKLKDDPTTVKLHLSGYGDEPLELGRDTEHAIVRMHKLSAPAEPAPAQRPKPAVVLPKAPAQPQPKPKKPSIGLDD
jgi:eukaryotic-like serine/threonine-protein kinase